MGSAIAGLRAAAAKWPKAVHNSTAGEIPCCAGWAGGTLVLKLASFRLVT